LKVADGAPERHHFRPYPHHKPDFISGEASHHDYMPFGRIWTHTGSLSDICGHRYENVEKIAYTPPYRRGRFLQFHFSIQFPRPLLDVLHITITLGACIMSALSRQLPDCGSPLGDDEG